MSELEHKETMQALTLPTMALRGITVFPSMLLHFDVGRQTSIKALDQAVELGSYLFLIPQKDLSVDDPELSDLYSIGTIAAVRQVLRLRQEGGRMKDAVRRTAEETGLSRNDLYNAALAEMES